MVATVHLTDQNTQILNELSHRTGKTPDELANEAVASLAAQSMSNALFDEWRTALLGIEGMVKICLTCRNYVVRGTVKSEWGKRRAQSNSH
jgi:hypothetical protein